MIIDGVKINYGIIDQSISDDTVTDASSENSEYSDIKNTMDADLSKDKIAYLEKDYFLLDGSYTFPEDDVDYNVGWESVSLSDSSGNINEYIEYQFANLHDSYGIQLTFPIDCVPTAFKLEYFNDTTPIGTVTNITDNTTTTYSNHDVHLKWNKVRLTFLKVNPQQRARLWQVVFGINDEYNEDMLISVSASRATDLTGDYDDCGEFSFQFYNDGRFDIKTINDLPVEIQEGLSVTVYIKRQGENVYEVYGNYYSESTEVDENGRIITVSGYDTLYALNANTFNKGVVYTGGRSLYDWAEEVAEDAGIEISIDETFKNVVSKGYITEVPHREALRLIAEAGNGILVVDKNGKISLKKHTPINKGDLTSDDIVDDTYMITNENKYLGINVSKYTYLAAKEAQELGYLEEVGLTSEPQEIEITYGTYPAVTSTIQVFVDTSTSAQISDLKVYSDRCVFNISGTDGDSTFVTVTGKPYNTVVTNVTKGSTSKNIKKIENNFLITDSIADDVADYQFERVVNKYQHEMEVVIDKKLDLGDKLSLNLDNGKDNVYITRTNFSVTYGEYSEGLTVIDE